MNRYYRVQVHHRPSKYKLSSCKLSFISLFTTKRKFPYYTDRKPKPIIDLYFATNSPTLSYDPYKVLRIFTSYITRCGIPRILPSREHVNFKNPYVDNYFVFRFIWCTECVLSNVITFNASYIEKKKKLYIRDYICITVFTPLSRSPTSAADCLWRIFTYKRRILRLKLLNLNILCTKQSLYRENVS